MRLRFSIAVAMAVSVTLYKKKKASSLRGVGGWERWD